MSTDEVEDVLSGKPKVLFKEKGKTNPEENLYVAFGTTAAGRYLFVVFILKSQQRALILAARDMTISERKYYEKKHQ